MKKSKLDIKVTAEQLDSLGLTPEQLEQLQKMSVEDDLPTPEMQRVEAGRLLSLIRKRNGLTQWDIAKKLNYSSQNFIYMVEKGRSKVPAAKINSFVAAYDADVKLSSVLIRCCHPDIWKMMLEQMYYLHDIDPGSTDYMIEMWIAEELRK